MADLEVTITHNLEIPGEVAELLTRKWIALDWGRKGPDPDKYVGGARSQIELFHEMKSEGAAVLAAYKSAAKARGQRLIGWVPKGADFLSLNGLLCLPLERARLVDASRSFLGNLSPRSCTIQRCSERSRGRLAALVHERAVERSVWSLHHRDVEVLVANYLMARMDCHATWNGAHSFEDLDHAAITAEGRELLAQTTVSIRLVREKATRLLDFRQPHRDLCFFGPEASRHECPPGIRYVALEEVFASLDATHSGRWLINLMLVAST